METKKFRVGKILLIILAILILGILIHTVRNFIIISNLQNMNKQYSQLDTYHIQTSYDDERTGHTETDYYSKGEKRAFFIVNTNNSGDVTKLLTYDNGKRVDFFADSIEGKNAYLGNGASPNMVISNGLDADNKFYTFILSFFATVRSTQYDGKECYMIKNFMSADWLYDENTTSVSYIEKETGFELLRIWDGRENYKITEIDDVDDSVFVEPNIAEYDIKEK